SPAASIQAVQDTFATKPATDASGASDVPSAGQRIAASISPHSPSSGINWGPRPGTATAKASRGGSIAPPRPRPGPQPKSATQPRTHHPRLPPRPRLYPHDRTVQRTMPEHPNRPTDQSNPDRYRPHHGRHEVDQAPPTKPPSGTRVGLRRTRPTHRR